MSYFRYEQPVFRYQPFPIGMIRPVMDEARYQELLANYPARELFTHLPAIGLKFALSERYNEPQYRAFMAGNRPWREFHRWIKSPEFIEQTLSMLGQCNLDLGKYEADGSAPGLAKRLRDAWRDRRPKRRLTTRFEFSMLPADGGYVIPHTDSPAKIVTIVLSMVAEGEWDQAAGGGTDVNIPDGDDLAFNWMNRTAPFERMKLVDTYAFEPNQAVFFIKTHNSWHSVRKMNQAGSERMRRTLTINIDEV